MKSKTHKPYALVWTIEDLQFLKDHYKVLDTSAIAHQLNRSVRSVYLKAFSLGIAKREPWTDAQIMYLQNHYKDQPIKELVAQLNREERTIRTKASRLNLVRIRKNKPNNNDQKTTCKMRKQFKSNKLRKYPSKAIEEKKERPIRIDAKTTIYVPLNATQKEIDDIVNRYKKPE